MDEPPESGIKKGEGMSSFVIHSEAVKSKVDEAIAKNYSYGYAWKESEDGLLEVLTVIATVKNSVVFCYVFKNGKLMSETSPY